MEISPEEFFKDCPLQTQDEYFKELDYILAVKYNIDCKICCYNVIEEDFMCNTCFQFTCKDCFSKITKCPFCREFIT